MNNDLCHVIVMYFFHEIHMYVCGCTVIGAKVELFDVMQSMRQLLKSTACI